MSKFNINICPLCGSKLMNQTDYRYCKSCEIRFLVQKNQLTLTHDMMMEMCDRAFARFPSAESADTFSKLQKFDSTFFPAAFGMALVICKEDRSDEQINHYLDLVYELSKKAAPDELQYFAKYGGEPFLDL